MEEVCQKAAVLCCDGGIKGVGSIRGVGVSGADDVPAAITVVMVVVLPPLL